MSAGPDEKHERLWMLVASPTVWAAHFMLSYCTAAVWCAKLAPGGGGSFAAVRAALAAYTIVALAIIAALGWHSWRRHRYSDSTLPHDFDSPADRHRFLGFASLLLAGLSAIAVLYAALAAFFIGSC